MIFAVFLSVAVNTMDKLQFLVLMCITYIPHLGDILNKQVNRVFNDASHYGKSITIR